jgi:2-desacetyl-2-hydroxyethyl bacteriochlorophyllide A dehydrogenase
VSYDEAAMLDPAGCIVHVFNRFSLEVGSTVAIIGTGTMGLIAVQIAKMMGAAKVVAVDLSAERLELAAAFGADVRIDPAQENATERILDETDGRGADAVVEAVGIGKTYESAVEAVRKRGTVIALGYIDEKVAFPMRSLIFREIDVLGCTGFTVESDTVLELISQGHLDVKPMITHGFSLDRVQEAFETASDPASGAIKVMVHP